MENTISKAVVKRRKRCRRGGNHIDIGSTYWFSRHIQSSAHQSGTDNLREDNKRKCRYLRGEVTVYLSLTFILLVAFVGAMLESASIQGAKNYGRADMNRALECVFAEYQKELLDEYDIFALDGSYETGVYSEDQIIDRLSYYGAGGVDQEILRIQFLTDDGCRAFYEQVAAYMEHKYGLDSVREMVGQTDIWQRQEERSRECEAEGERKQDKLEGLLKENEGTLPEEDNPISHMSALKTSPILELVIPKEMQISQKELELSELTSHRNLNTGYGDFSEESRGIGTVDTLLFGEYVMEHFGMATDETRDKALDYELEYILEGKASDKENLEEVVKRLLLIRFVPDYAYIQSDGELKAEAEALALTLCSLLAVPAITEAATQVILLAWAYGEAIVDLRSLLKGNRVPLLKTKESWQLGLSSLMTLGTAEDHNDGADAEGGLLYKEYLRMLLFLKDKKSSGERTLDLIEQNLRVKYGLDFFRADQCISKIELKSICKLRRGITFEFPTYFAYN